MKRILFVDDEQRILDGLRDLLRKQRAQWDMVFALGGEAALAELEFAPFDVIVSDMRMPGIDGPALLRQVQTEYPAAVRIVLSGFADRESVTNALPVAHQILGKPCPADALRSVLERACALSALLPDETLRAMLGKLDGLPSLPSVHQELTRVASMPDARTDDFVRFVELDPAIALKVLQLANSSYFGRTTPETSVQHAVAFLGTELLRTLILSTPTFSAADPAWAEGFSLGAFQEHALITARLAVDLVGDPQAREPAYSAGLVHDVGTLILKLCTPARFSAVQRRSRETGVAFHLVEEETLGVDHARVGAYLLGLWGIPPSLIDAVAFHHSPSRLAGKPSEAVIAVHVADALVQPGDSFTFEKGAPEAVAGELLDLPFLERWDLMASLPGWRSTAENHVRRMQGQP